MNADMWKAGGSLAGERNSPARSGIILEFATVASTTESLLLGGGTRSLWYSSTLFLALNIQILHRASNRCTGFSTAESHLLDHYRTHEHFPTCLLCLFMWSYVLWRCIFVAILWSMYTVIIHWTNYYIKYKYRISSGCYDTGVSISIQQIRAILLHRAKYHLRIRIVSDAVTSHGPVESAIGER